MFILMKFSDASPKIEVCKRANLSNGGTSLCLEKVAGTSVMELHWEWATIHIILDQQTLRHASSQFLCE
ncbi:hypothetical protein QR680_001945 [Steinernema hermaphroditum]|uniref:Uncharacterized protein n=1 Tax=Steinernema hermaphroditum TaxID=289476 RepID=A0AA39H1E8_9BILA|nr:hypothetical protein QR680_001945 [Steinernema hermaphroditum]